MTIKALADYLMAVASSSDLLAQEWESTRGSVGDLTLEELVVFLAQLRSATEALALVDSDLSTLIYDRVWKEYEAHAADIAGHHVEVNRSKSYSVDGSLLVAALASRLGDEMADAGTRMLDPETGDLVPPAETVRQIVEKVADVAGLRNASQKWAKTRLSPLGLDLDRFQSVAPGAKRVKIG